MENIFDNDLEEKSMLCNLRILIKIEKVSNCHIHLGKLSMYEMTAM
jgi:hypothetical protein